MRGVLAAIVCALAVAAAFAPASGATNECHGIQACIRVAGPWVVVPAKGRAAYLLTCPAGRSVVGGLDAQVTSRDVRISFEGRLGAPVQPGVTTTRYALFRAVSVSGRVQAFQPRLGCVPVQGGGGRSTVSAFVSPPGQSLEYRAHITILSPGSVGFAKVACQGRERLVGSWHALAFRTKLTASAFERRPRGRDARRRRKQIVGAQLERRALDRRARDRPGRARVRAMTIFVAVVPARAADRAGDPRGGAVARARRARYAVAFTNLDLLPPRRAAARVAPL